MVVSLHIEMGKKIVGMGHHGSGHRDRQELRSSTNSSFPFQPSYITSSILGAGHHGSGHRRHAVHGSYPSPSVAQNTVVVMPPPPPQPVISPIITVLPPHRHHRPQIIPSYHQFESSQHHHIPTSSSILQNSSTTPTIAASPIPIYQQSQENGLSCKNCCHRDKTSVKNTLCNVFWLLLASFSAVFLFTIIGSKQHQLFVLNPGETRRVVSPSPTFYKSLSIQYSPYLQPVENNIQVKTYFYPQQGCPQLTGPIVSLYTSNDLNLAFGDYEYDYFYLNAGSHITVSVGSSTRGSANVLLFRGQKSFDDWCRNNVAARPLVKRQAASGVVGTVLEYTVPIADTYYVVVENPNYFQQFVATQAVFVQATSYDLSEQFHVTPSPSGIATVNLHQHNENDCILVQVTSTTSSNVSGYDVTVTVRGHRRWIALTICAAVLALPFLLCCAKVRSKIVSSQSQPAACHVTYDTIQYTPVPQQQPELDPEIPIVEATLVHEQPVPSAPPLDALEK